MQEWASENNQLKPGHFPNLEFIKEEAFILSESNFYPIKITANAEIEMFLFFRNWPLIDFKGFENQIDKKTQTRGFTLNNFLKIARYLGVTSKILDYFYTILYNAGIKNTDFKHKSQPTGTNHEITYN